MIKKPVKGIYFDLGWTLFRPATGDWKMTPLALKYIHPQALSTLSVERQNEAFAMANACLENREMKTEAQELEGYTDFYRTMASCLPEIRLSQEQADLIAYDRVNNDANYIVFDDAKSTLEVLRGKYKLGLISDTDPSVIRVLKNTGLYDFFDTMTLSFDVGNTKPNKGMYLHALNEMNLPAKETLFVDDNEKNLEGAYAFDIQPLLVLSRPNSRAVSHYDSIKKLSDLLLIL